MALFPTTRKYDLLQALLPFLMFFTPVSAETSPNGLLKTTVDNGRLSVEYRQKGKWQKILSAEFPILSQGKTTAVRESYDMILGKKSRCKVRGKETVYTLEGGDRLLVRVHDDGVAFRRQAGNESVSDAEAAVSVDFSFAKHHWLMKWTDSYEEFFPIDRPVKHGDRFGYPSLFEYEGGVFALLSESDPRADNASSSLYSNGEMGKFRIVTDKNEKKAECSTWKCVMIGNLADIVESTLVTDLASPCKIDDTSWIEPGVASWIYWAYNHGSNDINIIRKYIDLAVKLKLPYVLIDAEWDEMPKVAANGGLDIEDAVKECLDNGIKPIIWYNSSVGWINGAPGPKFRLNKPEDREKEFAWCEKIGVKGVKIDFFSGDDNRNVSYMIDLLKCAEKHHLLVNFHGAPVPRGWQRTYPNLVSTEGVYGAEWYNNVPTFTTKAASHNAMLPFTRNVIGSMDYTPCAFSDSQHPHITTHAHELALTALYESGIQHLADRPESFLSQPDEVRDYLGNLPTAWDETHLLSGYPGKSVVMARRKGDVWYVAGINGTDEYLSLDYSALRRYVRKPRILTAFLDGDSKEQPWNIVTDADEMAKNSMKIVCKPRGGFVMMVK